MFWHKYLVLNDALAGQINKFSTRILVMAVGKTRADSTYLARASHSVPFD